MTSPHQSITQPKPALRWTQHVPTDPGFYWVRMRAPKSGKICAAIVAVYSREPGGLIADRVRWEAEPYSLTDPLFLAWSDFPIAEPLA